jgi:hypothetical protein
MSVKGIYKILAILAGEIAEIGLNEAIRQGDDAMIEDLLTTCVVWWGDHGLDCAPSAGPRMESRADERNHPRQ